MRKPDFIGFLRQSCRATRIGPTMTLTDPKPLIADLDDRRHQNRREVGRFRTMLNARIVFNNKMTTLECIVKNISPGGAMLAVADSVSVPNEFDLEIPSKQKFFRAAMRWRDGKAMGVAFLDHVSARELEIKSISGLEEENARLRAAVALLSKKLKDTGIDMPSIV